MASTQQKAILKSYINGTLQELMLKSVGEQIYLSDGSTVAEKIADIVLAVNERAKSSDVEAQIDAAVNDAVTSLIDGAPETYNTLKEIATYISEHQDIVDGLNSAIGSKADKSTVETIQTTLNKLGSLANKSSVSESDLDSALKEKVNAAAEGNHSHANKTALDGITAEKVAAWDAKSKIYYSATEPEALAAGDLWVQLI